MKNKFDSEKSKLNNELKQLEWSFTQKMNDLMNKIEDGKN